MDRFSAKVDPLWRIRRLRLHQPPGFSRRWSAIAAVHLNRSKVRIFAFQLFADPAYRIVGNK
jgi:hypothetical protein